MFHPSMDPRAAHSVLSAREPKLTPVSNKPHICNGGRWRPKSKNYLIKMTSDLIFRDHLLRIKQIILPSILEIQIFEKMDFFSQRNPTSTC